MIHKDPHPNVILVEIRSAKVKLESALERKNKASEGEKPGKRGIEQERKGVGESTSDPRGAGTLLCQHSEVSKRIN